MNKTTGTADECRFEKNIEPPRTPRTPREQFFYPQISQIDADLKKILNRQDVKSAKFVIAEKQSFVASLAPWRLMIVFI